MGGACAPSNGQLPTRTAFAPRWFSQPVHGPLQIRSAPRRRRSLPSSPIRIGRAVTTTERGRAPRTGLGIARRIAHLTYRTESELDARFENSAQNDENPWNGGRYAVQSYLEHQADKLVDRFDPSTYVLLTEAMNRHDIGRGRGGVAAALASITAPVVVGGVDSDRLYPLRLQEEIADGISTCSGLEILKSKDGHDGFLTEADAVAGLLRRTMEFARTAR